MQSLKLVGDKNSTANFNNKNHDYCGRLGYRSCQGSYKDLLWNLLQPRTATWFQQNEKHWTEEDKSPYHSQLLHGPTSHADHCWTLFLPEEHCLSELQSQEQVRTLQPTRWYCWYLSFHKSRKTPRWWTEEEVYMCILEKLKTYYRIFREKVLLWLKHEINNSRQLY